MSDNWEHCTPTYIMNELADEFVSDFDISKAKARKLVKRALGSDIVQNDIYHQVERYLENGA